MANIGKGRQVEFCPLCRQADDHPKHGIITDPQGIGTHMDCCRENGCPTGACDVILDFGEAKPGPGAKMLAHVVKVTADPQHQRRLEQHRDGNPQLRQFTVPSAAPTVLTTSEESR